MNLEFKCLGTVDLKEAMVCVFQIHCLFRFSLNCLSTLHIQIRGEISNGVIALYLFISSKWFTKATSWAQRAIGFTFSRVGWESARTKSLHSFWMRHIWEFGELREVVLKHTFSGKKTSDRVVTAEDYLGSLHTRGRDFFLWNILFSANLCQWFSQGSPCRSLWGFQASVTFDDILNIIRRKTWKVTLSGDSPWNSLFFTLLWRTENEVFYIALSQAWLSVSLPICSFQISTIQITVLWAQIRILRTILSTAPLIYLISQNTHPFSKSSFLVTYSPR